MVDMYNLTYQSTPGWKQHLDILISRISFDRSWKKIKILDEKIILLKLHLVLEMQLELVF